MFSVLSCRNGVEYCSISLAVFFNNSAAELLQCVHTAADKLTHTQRTPSPLLHIHYMNTKLFLFVFFLNKIFNLFCYSILPDCFVMMCITAICTSLPSVLKISEGQLVKGMFHSPAKRLQLHLHLWLTHQLVTIVTIRTCWSAVIIINLHQIVFSHFIELWLCNPHKISKVE